MLNLAIDSTLARLRCVARKLEDLHRTAMLVTGRLSGRQRRVDRVRFELADQTREAVDEYLRISKWAAPLTTVVLASLV
jgi:hypothetical protein